ncbi:winged helix-turn-helix domain-containing protein [Streptomyces sp. NPDC059752]|uniref:winged helix-turn-helix domain-containing protein n=1 Tax=unclassified Streptomyces TaxID=2593676 RepID=UPI00364757A3
MTEATGRSRCCPASVTREDREAPAALLDESARQGRTWTAAALCHWLAAERGVGSRRRWLTELLHRDGFRWKGTRDTLRHPGHGQGGVPSCRARTRRAGG